MNRSRGKRFIAGFLVVLALLTGACATAYAADWSVHTQPVKLVNGAPFLLQVKPTTKLTSLHGTWLKHEITFTFDPATKMWNAFAGVSFETDPGVYTLQLSGEPVGAKSPDDTVTFKRTITVGRGKYPKKNVPLGVPGKFTQPDPKQLQEIAESKKVKDDYLNLVSADREWSGDFNAPASAEISDVFGSQRLFNGEVKSTHWGLDFRVPTGTPVAAMNDGTVLLARPLYYEGNFVVIDHGQGLLTLYLHLSEFKVKEGDTVKRGQIVALSGGTGRATGPHLHVAVRWQGKYLDPAQIMKLNLPTTNSTSDHR